MVSSYSLLLRIVAFLQCAIVIALSDEALDFEEQEERQPNLLIIMTDEHNLRTLGCYRQHLQKGQKFIWGDGVNVNTPHIDSLAADGVLFTNFNVATPSCTPSRASFMTGYYPQYTGAFANRRRMKGEMKTFARILQQRAGYHTTYIGKWHLNGSEKPGFGDNQGDRKFGFDDIRDQFNRGHYKWFDLDAHGNMQAYNYYAKDQFKDRQETNYATDFLFDETMKVMNNQIDKGKKFALMLSIPDPHGPDIVRDPYRNQYKHFDFQLPKTGKATYRKSPANPNWAPVKQVPLTNAEDKIQNIEADQIRQTQLRNYFGMVKLIDDKVGDILRFLKQKGAERNTIVVFTSDHGDLMGEHGRIDKSLPYKTSAGAPFIIRYPRKIKKGKIIHTSYASPDFAPSILSLMGVDHSNHVFQGIDASEEILSQELVTERKQVRFSSFFHKKGAWSAAIDRQYKLVISNSDPPFLFDMKEDPDEMINFYEDEKYKDISEELRDILNDAIDDFRLALAYQKDFLLDTPSCYDPKDRIPSLKLRVCKDLRKKKNKKFCRRSKVSNFCPHACGKCCEDSPGIMRVNKEVKSCADIKNMTGEPCKSKIVRQFCPLTCGRCEAPPSAKPSVQPSQTTSTAPSSQPSEKSSTVPSSQPSDKPSIMPSSQPSEKPSTMSSSQPSDKPSIVPSSQPSDIPSIVPSSQPSDIPSIMPSSQPSDKPSTVPSSQPSGVSAAGSPSPSISPSKQSSNRPTYELQRPPSHLAGLPNEPSQKPSHETAVRPPAHLSN